LKLSRLSAKRTERGKLFHAFGPAIENALSPNLWCPQKQVTHSILKFILCFPWL